MIEMKAGRTCPIDYNIGTGAFKDIRHEESSIYVIGGLYGNITALKKIKEMAEEEEKRTSIKPILIFNGDYHWFDADISIFEEIEELTAYDIKLLGNVEKELHETRTRETAADAHIPHRPTMMPLSAPIKSIEDLRI